MTKGEKGIMRFRVHELAKEFNYTPTIFLEKLQKLGYKYKHTGNGVDREDVDKIREEFKEEKEYAYLMERKAEDRIKLLESQNVTDAYAIYFNLETRKYEVLLMKMLPKNLRGVKPKVVAECSTIHKASLEFHKMLSKITNVRPSKLEKIPLSED